MHSGSNPVRLYIELVLVESSVQIFVSPFTFFLESCTFIQIKDSEVPIHASMNLEVA